MFHLIILDLDQGVFFELCFYNDCRILQCVSRTHDNSKNILWLSDCPFISNKRQNGLTDRAQILCGTSYDPIAWFMDAKITKLCFLKFLIFVKFRKQKYIVESANFIVIVLYCVKRMGSKMEPQLKDEIEDWSEAS